MENPPKVGDHDGKGDLDEHVQLVNGRLSYFIIDDASKCKLFVLTLARSARLWFNDLLDGSNDS